MVVGTKLGVWAVERRQWGHLAFKESEIMDWRIEEFDQLIFVSDNPINPMMVG